MRVLEVMWGLAGDLLPGGRFAALVRWVLLPAAVMGLAVPEVRTAVFGWVVAQEAARIEPSIRAAMSAVVDATLRHEN